MQDILDRVRLALGGQRESTGPAESTPVLASIGSIIRRAARPAGMGAACLIALSACTSSPGQFGGYPVSGGTTIGSLMGQQGYGRPVNSIQGYQPDGAYRQDGYGAVRHSGMDGRDRMYAVQAAQAAEHGQVGQSYPWSNPVSGNQGYYRVLDRGSMPDGRRCMHVETSVLMLGHQQPEMVRQYNCQGYNGTWQRMSELDINQSTLLNPGARVADAEPAEPVPAMRMG